MEIRKVMAYMALRHADGSEPSQHSGYERVLVGELSLADVATIPHTYQIVFNDAVGEGYGMIADYCLFNCPTGGEPLRIWPLYKPVNAHAGTIPFIRQGALLLGVDVSASTIVSLQSVADTQ